MRRATYLVVLFALSACGSKKKKQAPEVASPSGSGGSAVTDSPHPAAAAQTGALTWDQTPAFKKPPRPYPDPFDAPPLPPIADPDAVIARYGAQCPNRTRTDACKDLRRQVERIFLGDIIGLRAAHVPIDRKWFSVAIGAETPQLACLGVNGLARLKDRTPDEEAAILSSVDHPSWSVREAAMATRLPAMELLSLRAYRGGDRGFVGACLDGRIDREYSNAYAGGYPNAKYRFLASSPTQRWFTTPDSVEKVYEFFIKQGRPPMTREAVQAAMTAKMAAEIQRITSTMKEDEVEKANKEVAGLAAKFVVPNMPSIDGAGEIRYVMLTDSIGIAIFKDDTLKGTSIVALAPPVVPDITQEGMQRQMQAREIYGF